MSWKQRWHGRNIWVAIVEGWVAAESFVAFLNSLPCLLKTCEKVRRSGHDLPIGRLDLTKGDNGPSTPSGIGSTRQNIIITEASLSDDVTLLIFQVSVENRVDPAMIHWLNLGLLADVGHIWHA